MSLRRNRNPAFKGFWIPASAEVTVLNIVTIFVAVPLKRDVITHDRLWKGLVVVLLRVRGIAAAAAG